MGYLWIIFAIIGFLIIIISEFIVQRAERKMNKLMREDFVSSNCTTGITSPQPGTRPPSKK